MNYVTTHTAGADGVFEDIEDNDKSDDSLVTSRYDSSLKLLGESYSTVSGESLGAVSYERDEESETTSAFDGISRIGVSGRNPENLLKNHRMESMDNWTPARISDSGSVYTASVANDVSHSGQNSIKLTVTDFAASGGVCLYQLLKPANGEIESGKKYVASVYVKTDGITYDSNASSSQSYGASIMVRTIADGKTNTAYGESVQKTDSTVDGGWTRVFIYFTVPQNCTSVYIAPIIRNGKGTAYFDSIQLEEGEIPSQYNLVENNSFERVAETGLPENWVGTASLESSDIVTNGEFRIVGNPDKQKALYQNIYIDDAYQEDTYVFSAWSHGDGVPNGSGKHYCLFGCIYYKDAEGNLRNAEGKLNQKNITTTYFDSNSTGDQFISIPFDLSVSDETWTPICIRVAVCYYGGLNNVYFDNISLIKTSEVFDLNDESIEDETGDSYTYDENGNVLTYTDVDGVLYEYTYHTLENGVFKVATERVTETITENDVSTTKVTLYEYDTAGNVIRETAPDNSVYLYEYNGYGDLVSRLKTVIVDGVETQIGDRYTYVQIYDKYYIQNEEYEDGSTCTYEYRNEDDDPDNDSTLKTKTIVSDGVTEVYSYDPNENLTSYVVDNETKSSYTYVEKNGKWLVETETHSDGNSATYTYYDDGSTATMTKTENGKYRGYVYDNETGLYYLQSRYYDPETGRFLNADDVDYIGASGTVLGYNAFAYCENNAVNDSDTNGTISYNKIIKLIVNSFLLIVKLIVVLYRFIEAHFYRDRCNRIIYISSFFLSTAIDALIALATNSLMYRGLKNILRLILENKIIRGKFINWVFNFLLYKKIGKGLLWLLYRLGLLIAGKEGVIGVAIKSAFQDWLLNILSFKNDVLKRATAFIMSFSSIGGMIALIMDFGDGYYDDWVVINY